ncbi:IucA/IucC family protein [Streptomyces sp. MS06]|uniref:IucA/IucC family protein n=1 Tax=Streptomyces sp. MS06 TaxID=3385974 RepID=UPI00399F895C
MENLLRCWVRERGLPAPADGLLRVALPMSGTALLAPVHYWSATGWHRFGPARLAGTPAEAPAVDAVALATLLGRESHGPTDDATDRPAAPRDAARTHAAAAGRDTACTGDFGDQSDGPAARAADQPAPAADIVPRTGQPAPRTTVFAAHATEPAPRTTELSAHRTDFAAHATDLVARVADSVHRTATFLDVRRDHPTDGPDLFLTAEQALLLGHPLHPAPKSREGLSETESPRYSPEAQGSFPLRWIAVAPPVLTADSAWTEHGRPVTAERLTARLAGAGLPLPDGCAALPLHPWQWREARRRPGVAALLDAGLLRDLGDHGAPWHPTSSVRTVYRPGAPAMLKLSLAVRITNSRRENLRKELHRGVEAHRLLRAGLAGRWHAAHPGFDIVRDPAWLAVDDLDGVPVPGLDVMIRHSPFGPGDDVACVAGLVALRPRPCPAAPAGTADRAQATGSVMRSRLAELLTGLAARSGRPRGAVAVEWFLRYLDQVVLPVLWLDGEAGVALEAHQQNTLLVLDADGWPAGGRYRDNQGYYFRESRRRDLDARLPGIGGLSDTFVSDEVVDERFTYYLAINNVFGLVGAFGAQRLADERLLLAAFRRFLEAAASGPGRMRSTLPGRLLDAPALRCKANLLTRLHGLDELVGPVDTQSVYVTVANPLHA